MDKHIWVYKCLSICHDTVFQYKLLNMGEYYLDKHPSQISNIIKELGNSISLEQNQFLLGTQAFASPPDMASSGV